MTAKISPEDAQGKRTITFEYVVDSQKALDTADAVGRRVFSRYQPQFDADVKWDDLSNAERLQVLDWAVRDALLDHAQAAYVETKVIVARQEATLEAKDKYL